LAKNDNTMAAKDKLSSQLAQYFCVIN